MGDVGGRRSLGEQLPCGGTAYLPSSTSSDSGDQTVNHYTGSGNVDSTTNSTLAATAALTYNPNGTVTAATAPNNVAVGTTPANPTRYGYDSYTFQLNLITPPTGTSLGTKALTRPRQRQPIRLRRRRPHQRAGPHRSGLSRGEASG